MRIYPHITAIFTLLLVLISPLKAGTREKRIGTFHSPKGFGISAQIDTKNGDEINTFNLYADTYGLLSGRTSDVGIASVTRTIIFCACMISDIAVLRSMLEPDSCVHMCMISKRVFQRRRFQTVE